MLNAGLEKEMNFNICSAVNRYTCFSVSDTPMCSRDCVSIITCWCG